MALEKRPSRRNPKLAPLLLLFTLAFLLVSCDAQENWTDVPGPAGEPVKIRYVAPGGPTWPVPEGAAIEQFHEQMPDIEIDRQRQARNLSHYLSESPPPDVVFGLESYELRHAAQQNLLFDLSDIWADNNLAEAYGRQFREVGRVDGTFRLVPVGSFWAGIYYNREVFARYDLVPPATWEEFVTICETLLANGETPLSVAGQSTYNSYLWFSYLNMRLNGPSFHRHLIQGQESYTDERIALVWESWISLFRRGYFTERPNVTSESGSMKALIPGVENSPLTAKEAVMTLAPHFSLRHLSPESASELDVFQFPQIDPNSSVGEIVTVFGYVIPAEAAHQPEASAFVAYMASAEAQTMQMARIVEDPTNVGFVPLHREVDRALLPMAARKAEEIVDGADEVFPPLALALPRSMLAGFTTVIDGMFKQLNTPETEIDVSEIQSILEEARQQALQRGDYRQ